MDSKVRIGPADTRASDEAARSEKQRADDLARQLSAIRNRLRKFHNTIEYVQFPDAGEHTPPWAENWLDWLLTGAMPTPEAEPGLEPTPDVKGEAEAAPEAQPPRPVDGLDGKAASNAGVQAGETVEGSGS